MREYSEQVTYVLQVKDIKRSLHEQRNGVLQLQGSSQVPGYITYVNGGLIFAGLGGIVGYLG